MQDGDVPVTVVRRDIPDPAMVQSGPTSSRLQRVEAALAMETAARERADRALAEAQASIQGLQTKIGHAELTKNEAVAAAKREHEELVSLRQEIAALTQRSKEAEVRAEEAEEELHALRAELNEERKARKVAERLLEEASAEAETVSAPIPFRPAAVAAAAQPARRGRPPGSKTKPVVEEDAEPVKWWLLPAKTAGKRR